MVTRHVLGFGRVQTQPLFMAINRKQAPVRTEFTVGSVAVKAVQASLVPLMNALRKPGRKRNSEMQLDENGMVIGHGPLSAFSDNMYSL